MSSQFKPWLFLAMIFLAGGMTGAALTLGLSSHFLHAPGAQQMKSHWMMRLTQRLNLTADQQAKIDPILTDSENQIQSVSREDGERVSQIIQKTNTQIAAILTPEQQTELDKMSREMEQNRDRMNSGHHGWGGSHGGPGGGGMMMHSPRPSPDASTNGATDGSSK